MKASARSMMARRSTAGALGKPVSFAVDAAPGFHALLLLKALSRKLRPGVVSAAVSSKLPYR
jgi:hypothetical protein